MSRYLRCAALAAVAGVLALLAGIFPAAASDPGINSSEWSQFQGNPAHTGGAPDGLPPPYERAWEFQVDGPDGPSTPVMDDGVVYALGPNSVFAVDAENGHELWSVARTSGEFLPAPALARVGEHDELLFVQGSGDESTLSAVNVATHDRVRAIAPLGGDVVGGVTVAEGMAFVGDSSGAISAIDLVAGEQRWTRDLGEYPLALPPPVDAGTLFANAPDKRGIQHLFALDVATGEPKWQIQMGLLGPVTSGLAVADGRVYIAFQDGSLRAYSVGDGALVWSRRGVRPAPAPRPLVSPFTSPAVADGRVFVAGEAGGLYAFDAASGEPVWDYQFSGGLGGFVDRSAPVVAGGAVLVGLQDGRLAAVDTAEGTGIFEVAEAADPDARRPLMDIAVANDLVVASRGGTGGGLLAFRADPGGRLTETESPTDLRLGSMLAAFAAALVIVAGMAFGLTWIVTTMLARRRPPDDPWEGDAGGEDGSDG